jgi:ABC-type antimicrobial peptide transport system permease subunit
LAGIGIYGVTSYAVSQRTQELGIRMALGASRRTVFALVLKKELRAAVSGVIIGLLSSLGLSRVIASQLYGVPVTDLATYMTVTLVLIGVAVAAGCLPAWRATQVDPLTALRSE